MRQNPISIAFEHVDVEPSTAFREQLRVQFLAAVQPGVSAEVSFEAARHDVVDSDDVDTVNVVEARPPRRRVSMALGIAASIAIVAALTIVVFNRHSEPNEIDTSRDPAIAESSLISPKQVGVSWQISHQYDSLTSRDVADVAANVSACAAYVDYAFDSPRRQAATAGRIFSSPQQFALTQWVYIFPTEAAATRAMDKIAEASFEPCLSQFMDALMPKIAGTVKTTTVEPPPLGAHGDRQVVLGQSIDFSGVGAFTVMNVFVQVGRGIVYVNPSPDAHDSLDPAGRLEKVLTAATDDLTTALESANG